MKYYVHTPTKAEAKELSNIFEKNRYRWIYESDKNFCNWHEQNTCLVFYPNRKEILYGKTSFVETEFKDFTKLTIEEVKKMLNLTPKNMKYYVQTQTKAEARELLTILGDNKYYWRNGDFISLYGDDYWDKYEKDTCYLFNTDYKNLYWTGITQFKNSADFTKLTMEEVKKMFNLTTKTKNAVDLEIVQKKIVKYSDDTVSYALDEIKINYKTYTPEELHEESKRLIRTRTRYNKLIKSNQL